MNNRNYLTPFFKSKDLEKLIVYHASSLQNEIRFYINYTQYFTAVECEEGCITKFEEEKSEECNKKSKISIVRENLKEFIILFSIFIGISILVFIVAEHFSKTINNTYALLIILIAVNTIFFCS